MFFHSHFSQRLYLPRLDWLHLTPVSHAVITLQSTHVNAVIKKLSRRTSSRKGGGIFPSFSWEMKWLFPGEKTAEEPTGRILLHEQTNAACIPSPLNKTQFQLSTKRSIVAIHAPALHFKQKSGEAVFSRGLICCAWLSNRITAKHWPGRSFPFSKRSHETHYNIKLITQKTGERTDAASPSTRSLQN